MKIQHFNGGLNTKMRPQFLQANQGVVYENIDNDVGTLAPIKGLLATDKVIKPYFKYYEALQTWLDSDLKVDYLEYQGDMYICDRIGRPQRFDGRLYTNLGIDVPEDTMRFEAIEAPESPKEFTLSVTKGSAGSNQGLPRSVYSYLLLTEDKERSKGTYIQVNSADEVLTLGEDIQYLPKPTAIVTDPGDDEQIIKWSGYPSDTVPMKIYRYYDRKWRFVTEIKKGETFVDNTLDLSTQPELAEDALPALTGTVSYLLTYYNEKDGTESGPNNVSEEIELGETFGTILITDIPSSSDPQVTHKRLYRVGGNLGRFTLVKELDKDVHEFIDNVADSKAEGVQLPLVNAEPAPDGLAFMTEAYAMMFGATGATLRFTPIGVPYSWPTTYFLEYDSDITGIAPAANGLLVFTRFRTHIVVGTSPETLSSYLLSGDQGCLAFESIQLIGTEVVWVSSDGVCRSSGGRPEVMTRKFLNKTSIKAVSSAVYDEVYYVLDETGKLLSVGDGIVKVLDTGVERLAVANDVLFGRKGGVLQELFNGSSNLTFKYKSPIYTEGSFTTNKTYKKVFVYSTGYVKINIMLDGQLVATKELTGEDNHEILVPSEKQRGNYIQFEIEGTGEVYEIEYIATEQQKR
ncbi:internal virion protein [Vibrio phage VPMS1]|uniref:internal virion protein n=1 Tax=Vibrio phage VPMS1 TaxID=1233488 RepID=UPI0003585E29|nr:internal virion protein [Vibrio phage VPMS1]AFV51095.1 hypothetical protein MS_016 [Vibrio phage VPMS1]